MVNGYPETFYNLRDAKNAVTRMMGEQSGLRGTMNLPDCSN